MYDNIKPECNEELGEIICPECKGKGVLEHGKMEFMDYVCPKCQGEGKLDWCQQAVGVKPKHVGIDTSGMYSFQTFAESTPSDSTASFRNFYMQAIDQAAKKLAEDVDREILRSLENAAEHNNEIKIVVDKRRRQGYDYGVFSELMLFPSVESEDENKKD